MKAIFPLLILIMTQSSSLKAQEVRSMSFNELNQLLKNNDGKTRVINLWATWCKPCVEELPYFVKAKTEAKDENTEFIFVSVDFQSQAELVKEKARQLNLSGTLVHLNEKGNDWIDSLDPEWSGAIPFTIMILPDGKRVYHYDAFDDYNALNEFLNKNLPN